jgi:AAA+ ATPase superfamily predicted ATPase
MKLKNSFLVRGYAGTEYFCDRETEIHKLISMLENDRDVALIVPRRFGKTWLIHHVFSHLPEEYVSIYFDIFSTRNLSEFTSLFASAVVGKLDTKIETAMSAVARFFRSCRPTITP